jgi:signal transduction histidine kinase
MLDFGQAPDAASSVKEVTEALLPAAMLKNMQLRLAPHIEMEQDWKVVGEKSRLERVIFNLVENALRHGPPDSTVTVDVRADGGNVLISVDDAGRGVPAESVSTLFEKFSQGGRHVGKAGLGLYFCRITVEHWGGSIGYTPRPEGGSRFWLRLPRPRQH